MAGPEDFTAQPDRPTEKSWTRDELLKMWPQVKGELRGFQRALEARSGITAAQIGMAIQLGDVEFERLQTHRI